MNNVPADFDLPVLDLSEGQDPRPLPPPRPHPPSVGSRRIVKICPK